MCIQIPALPLANSMPLGQLLFNSLKISFLIYKWMSVQGCGNIPHVFIKCLIRHRCLLNINSFSHPLSIFSRAHLRMTPICLPLFLGCFQVWVLHAQLLAKNFHMTFPLNLNLLKNQTFPLPLNMLMMTAWLVLVASPLSQHLECGGKRGLLAFQMAGPRIPPLPATIDMPSSDFTQFYLSPQNANLPQISAFYNIYKSSSFLDHITPLLKTFSLSRA